MSEGIVPFEEAVAGLPSTVVELLKEADLVAQARDRAVQEGEPYLASRLDFRVNETYRLALLHYSVEIAGTSIPKTAPRIQRRYEALLEPAHGTVEMARTETRYATDKLRSLPPRPLQVQQIAAFTAEAQELAREHVRNGLHGHELGPAGRAMFSSRPPTPEASAAFRTAWPHGIEGLADPWTYQNTSVLERERAAHALRAWYAMKQVGAPTSHLDVVRAEFRRRAFRTLSVGGENATFKEWNNLPFGIDMIEPYLDWFRTRWESSRDTPTPAATKLLAPFRGLAPTENTPYPSGDLDAARLAQLEFGRKQIARFIREGVDKAELEKATPEFKAATAGTTAEVWKLLTQETWPSPMFTAWTDSIILPPEKNHRQLGSAYREAARAAYPTGVDDRIRRGRSAAREERRQVLVFAIEHRWDAESSRRGSHQAPKGHRVTPAAPAPVEGRSLTQTLRR